MLVVGIKLIVRKMGFHKIGCLRQGISNCQCPRNRVSQKLDVYFLGYIIIGEPGTGSTETFLSIGILQNEKEARNVIKYICSKFARAMFGILKRTQANTPDKWKWVPLQNFTDKSDIDWSVSIANIDKQLYKKYGLSEEEIAFIETNVKEME